jgi:transposase
VAPTPDSLPDDIATLKAMVIAAQAARLEAEAMARNAEAEVRARELVIEQMKFAIAKLRHERFGQSSERSAVLEQLELRLADMEEDAAQAEAAAQMAANAAANANIKVQAFERRKPARRPLPAHLPRERVVYPSPTACPCCGGALHKLGEDVTETLELIPRQWKVIQHVREKYSCRTCEAITQPPAPSHPIARGRAGPSLLAHILFSKYGLHLPLNRQSKVYAREGIELDSPRSVTGSSGQAHQRVPALELEVRTPAKSRYVATPNKINHALSTIISAAFTGRVRLWRGSFLCRGSADRQ